MQTNADDETKSDDSDKDILATAKKRFNLAVEAETENRKNALDDLRFMVGEQWPDEIKRTRDDDKRPCLTINRIPQFVRQITNDQRQNRPSIKINPVDDRADVDTAKIFQGIVRHIEYNSHADIAYDTAFEGGAATGLGYFRIITDYSDPMSFQQEIKIKRVKDRFSVYLDPYHQEPDGSDCEWGFIIDKMSSDEYKMQYADSDLSNMGDWTSIGDSSEGWVEADYVRVAEYYYKTYEPTEIVMLTDRTVLTKDQHKQLEERKAIPEGLRVISERKTLVPKIKWCKINGQEILDRTDVPGEWIPIIPVVGEEQLVDGKRVLSGIIRHAKDPQRMYNYWASSETETIALAPRAPWIGYEGQFEGYEEQWKTANVKNHAFLQVKAKMLGGQPAPLPQRNIYEPPVQAITQARGQAADDLKATTGIYDATLGNRSNEQSGIAIQRRNSQSQTSNYHFIDNLSRSLRHAGRIIVCWIPKVYDTPQAIRIIGDDGEVDVVQINQTFQEGSEQKSYMLDVGKYDVTVDTGPSFATKRQEAVASMLDLTRTAPQLMQVAGDIMVRNMDWPGASEIAERIKKTLPPNIVDDPKDGQPQLPPQAQQQIAQMSQMIQQLSKELNTNSDLIRTKRLELESKERIALMENETALKVEILKHDAKDAQLIFETEVDRINNRLALLNANESIAAETQMQPPPGQPSQQENPTGGTAPGTSVGAQP